MKISIGRVFLVLSLLAILGERSAFAQSEPTYSYTFSSLTAGLRQSGGNYKVDDFFLGAINQHLSSIDVSITFTADSNTYVFTNHAGECQGSGGVFTIGPTTIDYFGMALVNVLNDEVLASTTEFTGSVTEESVGDVSFYAPSPNTFSVSSASYHSSLCDAYYDAWETLSVGVPIYWDGPSSTLIGAYANTWHNDVFWSQGWYTAITVTNDGAETENYTIGYFPAGSGAVEGFDPTSCDGIYEYPYGSMSVGVSDTWAINSATHNLTTDILLAASTDVLRQDGFFYINLDPVVGGTEPTAYIYPNSSGTASSCGDACSMVTSCS